MEQAFTALRKYARDHNLRLVEVAEAVIAGSALVSLGPGGKQEGSLSTTRPRRLTNESPWRPRVQARGRVHGLAPLVDARD